MVPLGTPAPPPTPAGDLPYAFRQPIPALHLWADVRATLQMISLLSWHRLASLRSISCCDVSTTCQMCSPQSCRHLMTMMGRSLLDSVVTESDGPQACATAGFPTRPQSRTCAARAASSRRLAGAVTPAATRPRRTPAPRWLPRRSAAAEVLPRPAPGPMATICGADVWWRWDGRIRLWLTLLAAQGRGAVAAVAVSSAFPDASQPVLPLQWFVRCSGSAADSCVPQGRERVLFICRLPRNAR